MRESVIERYLHDSVFAHGGTTRKWTSPGRKGVPDRIVIWDQGYGGSCQTKRRRPLIHFIETKAPGKKARPDQIREHGRLQALGCTVLILDTKSAVDDYIKFRRKFR